jgi:hypothetical protein
MVPLTIGIAQPSPGFLEQDLGDRGADHHRDQQQQDRHRRRVADLEVLEAGEIGVIGDGLGRGARAALGHDVDLVELAERVEQADQKRDRDHPAQHRQDHVAQALPVGGAVELGDLEQLLGQRDQAGEQHERDERGPLPDVGDDDRQQGGLRTGGPLKRAEAEDLEQQVVDRAELDLIEQAPHVADHHRGDHHRHQDQREVHGFQAAAAGFLEEEQGERHADHELGGDRAGEEIAGLLHRDPETRIGQHAGEVAQADEAALLRARQVEIEQADVDRIDEGKDRQREQDQERRRDQGERELFDRLPAPAWIAAAAAAAD